MKNYQVDGRDATFLELRAWLIENAPQYESTGKDFRYVNNKVRVQLLREKARTFSQRCKINVKWRVDLSNRLRIKPDDVLRATNTIVELMEQELQNAGTVRITNFGDLKLITMEDGTKSARFYADEQWKRELNEPLFDTEIGLKRKYAKKKLSRRI